MADRQAAEPRGTSARLHSYSARAPAASMNMETSTHKHKPRTRASTIQSYVSPSWPPYLNLASPQSIRYSFTQSRLEEPAQPNRILIIEDQQLSPGRRNTTRSQTTQSSQAKMSDKANPSSDSTAASGSTSSKSFTPYTITSSGTNSQVRRLHPPTATLSNQLQGNHHDSRIQPAGPAYHYSNSVSSSCTSDGANGMGGADKCRTGVTTTRTATSRRTTMTGRGVLRTRRPMGMCTRSDGVSGAGVDGHRGGWMVFVLEPSKNVLEARFGNEE